MEKTAASKAVPVATADQIVVDASPGVTTTAPSAAPKSSRIPTRPDATGRPAAKARPPKTTATTKRT